MYIYKCLPILMASYLMLCASNLLEVVGFLSDSLIKTVCKCRVSIWSNVWFNQLWTMDKRKW
jgi:hypothetical protein